MEDQHWDTRIDKPNWHEWRMMAKLKRSVRLERLTTWLSYEPKERGRNEIPASLWIIASAVMSRPFWFFLPAFLCREVKKNNLVNAQNSRISTLSVLPAPRVTSSVRMRVFPTLCELSTCMLLHGPCCSTHRTQVWNASFVCMHVIHLIVLHLRRRHGAGYFG